jgi:hypothetical protein
LLAMIFSSCCSNIWHHATSIQPSWFVVYIMKDSIQLRLAIILFIHAHLFRESYGFSSSQSEKRRCKIIVQHSNNNVILVGLILWNWPTAHRYNDIPFATGGYSHYLNLRSWRRTWAYQTYPKRRKKTILIGGKGGVGKTLYHR